ncbi:MAG: hypothetical protein P8172_13885 [Gammaproteobacteria bacterium]|jgi:hypothetical protein
MMSTHRPLALILGLGLVCMGVAGCTTDQATVTLHEPGVYKGAEDPLRQLQKDPSQQAALEERLLQGQTDRKSARGTG